jgi:hypothetical protein
VRYSDRFYKPSERLDTSLKDGSNSGDDITQAYLELRKIGPKADDMYLNKTSSLGAQANLKNSRVIPCKRARLAKQITWRVPNSGTPVSDFKTHRSASCA